MALLRKLQRFSSMSSGEFAFRLRQEINKRTDSLLLFQSRFDPLPESASTQTGRFFFDKEEIPQRIQLIRENLPDFEVNTLDQAEQILNHHIPLLGYGPLDCRTDIDWQLDIVSGKRSPLKPCSQI